MKLLHCISCGDIFNLTGTRVKECHCGKVKGVYVTHSEAITNGKGVSIAMGNGSFDEAMYKSYALNHDEPNADRERYMKICNIRHFWIRPNEGIGNPHQFVVGDDHEGWNEEK